MTEGFIVGLHEGLRVLGLLVEGIIVGFLDGTKEGTNVDGTGVGLVGITEGIMVGWYVLGRLVVGIVVG